MILDPSEGVNFKSGIRYDTVFDGHAVTLVKPRKPEPAGRWVWRAEFFDAFPSVDDALLDAGYSIAYIQLSDRFGCPEVVEDMEKFRDWLTASFSLSRKAAVFGFSRGGLYAVNYAFRYPENVAVLYLDAPVLNIYSWPAGFGYGIKSASDWDMCKLVYHLSEKMVNGFTDLPKGYFAPLAQNGIPIVLVAGDADEVVVWEENGKHLADDYTQMGGKILVILKPGCKHHPHSLADPESIVEFIRTYY
jgi:pimeloyl-ACP methyl ester carboxylesterase